MSIILDGAMKHPIVLRRRSIWLPFLKVFENLTRINQKYNMNVIRTETSLKPLRKRLCQESNARLMKLRTLSNRL